METSNFVLAFGRLGMHHEATLARIIAGLDGAETLDLAHVAEAVQYRSLDRQCWTSSAASPTVNPPRHTPSRAAALPLLCCFTITLFVSAFLLFSVQPMFAKLVLPVLGGAPAVWNTCLVFFQAMLLLGYGYAHAATRWLGVRRQAAWHLVVLLLPLWLLPLRLLVQWAPPIETNPIPWLLGVLTLTVGVPFFVIAASAPLLQAWFAQTGHPDARDPYFLYAASNAGSLIALVSYPVLIEPHLRLIDQRWLWAMGYGLLVILVAGCAGLLWRTLDRRADASPVHTPPTSEAVAPTVRRRLAWVLWAAVPSSLLLGVTTYLSTDIAAIPLLWVVPLALYLLTFICAFARPQPLPHALMVNLMPIPVLTLALLMICGTKEPLWLLVTLHLLTFFVIAMVCHGALAGRRPPAAHLTSFYLWLSVGGVLGGLCNALIAPQVFDRVVEYPLALVVACLLRPGTRAPARLATNRCDYLLPLGMGLLLVACCLAVGRLPIPSERVRLLLTYVPAMMLCFLFRYRPIRFGLGVGVLLLVGAWASTDWRQVLDVRRSFFGVYRVTEAARADGLYHALLHGRTLHGMQNLRGARRHDPLTYYARGGPIGQVLAARPTGAATVQVAVIGLGTGSMAAYAGPTRRITFYEIDPLVYRLATTPRYFTYLSDCGDRCRVVLGDARRSLVRAPDQGYDVIAVDAFSSDAIPVHLLTLEALHLYLRKLADGGVIALHISNRYLALRPVVGDLAGALGLACLAQQQHVTPAETKRGLSPSEWVVLARRVEDFGPLATDARWGRVTPRPHAAVWTDDFSNLISVLQWR